MTSAPVRLSLVMKAMQTVGNHYRGVVRDIKANRKRKLKEGRRNARAKWRKDHVDRGIMSIEMNRLCEKAEEDSSSDSECYGVLYEAPRKRDQAERVRIDGIVAERLAVFEVSELLLRGLPSIKWLPSHKKL